MIKKFFIAHFIVWFLSINLYAQAFQKGIVVDQFLYYSSSNNHLQMIIFKDIEKPGKMDSFPVSSLLSKTSGVFYENSLAWDIVGNSLFVINLFEDNFGMNYTQLRLYDIAELKRLYNLNKDSLNNYLISTSTIKSKPVGPVEKYASSITYRTDTLSGKVYFDITCDNKELNLFIYIQEIKKLEVWRFTRYPIVQGYISATNKDEISEIYKKKPWEQVYTQTLDISCPFRIFNLNGNNYIISSSGHSLNLSSAASNKKRSKPIQSITESLLVLNKNEDEIMTISKDRLTKAEDNQVKDTIKKFAKKINLDK